MGTKIKGLKRVVITGLGLVTPLGLNVPSTWQAIVNGDCGIDCGRGFGLAPGSVSHQTSDPQQAVFGPLPGLGC